MNYSNNFDKTDREYSLAPTDDLITRRFCRSTVKVTAGLSIWWWRRPHRCWIIEVIF